MEKTSKFKGNLINPSLANENKILVGSVGNLEPQSHISYYINKTDNEGDGYQYSSSSKSSSSSNDSF